MQGAQVPPHMAPMFSPSGPVPWNPQLSYPLHPMQMPYDQSAMMPPMVTKAVSVPSSCVGIVIGRNGETIRDLQQRSGAHIKVTPDEDARHGATERVIYITGTPASLDLAQSLVNDVINEGLTRVYRDGVEPRSGTEQQEGSSSQSPHLERRQGGPVDEGNPEQSESTKEEIGEESARGADYGQIELEGQPVDSAQAAKPLDYTDADTFPELAASGRDQSAEGSTSLARSEALSARNNVPEEGDTGEDMPSGWNRTEQEQASPESPDDDGSRTVETSAAPFTGEGRVVPRPATDYPSASISFEMQIPHAKVGVIIGKNGSTIRSLQQISGARIVVSKRMDRSREDHPRPVTITGPEVFVETARRLIIQKINPSSEDYTARDDRDNRPGAREGEDPTDQPAIDSLTTELGNQSLSGGSRLPPMVPGSPVATSPSRMSQTPPYGIFQRGMAFPGANPGMAYPNVAQYPSMRQMGRADSTEYRAVDAQTHQAPQYPTFMGGVRQGFGERMPLGPTTYPFPHSSDSGDTMPQSFGEFRQDQFYPQGLNIFGGSLFDGSGGAGGTVSDTVGSVGQGQGFHMLETQGFDAEAGVYPYQVGEIEQHGGAGPSSTA